MEKSIASVDERPVSRGGCEDRLGVDLAAVGEIRCLVGGEHCAQLLRYPPGLRRVRLVGDDREPPTGESLVLTDRVQRERECLHRDDHDQLAAEQLSSQQSRLRPLARLAHLVGVDRRDRAVDTLDLLDRLLQLVIQNRAVGHHDDGVEHLVIAGVVQVRQPVREPRDRVRLARPCRVLHQVPVPRPLLAHRGKQRRDELPLVVTGEQQRRRLRHLTGDRVRRRALLDMQQASDDVQPGIPLHHALPQIRRRSPARVHRVARASVVTEVERQKVGLRAGEARGHRDLVVRHGEVHQTPVREPQQRLALRIAMVPVLLDRIIDGLCVVGLQLDRRDRQPVHEQHQVDRLGVHRGVVHLPHHPQPNRGVPCSRGLVQ